MRWRVRAALQLRHQVQVGGGICATGLRFLLFPVVVVVVTVGSETECFLFELHLCDFEQQGYCWRHHNAQLHIYDTSQKCVTRHA